MDFFAHQAAARRRTALLVVYFLVAVILIVVAVYLAVVLIFVVDHGGRVGWPEPETPFWYPELFLRVAGGTLLLVVAGSLVKIAALRRGGQAVAEALGGTPVAPDTRDRQERRLLNVVAEMAIASGMPAPSVYVLRDESGINAFAAGYNTGDAVVAVTSGTLQTLSRSELQGVVAHEFSHILNGDMRLNIRLMGVLHGILLIGLLGRAFMGTGRHRRPVVRTRSGSRRGGGALILLALALFAIGYIGVFFARVIKASVSRQREFLADASAVQFTRNPDGIAGALKKIGGLIAGSRLTAPNAETASHLFFSSGLSAPFAALLATHPPLGERIRRIDPAWDGRYPDVDADRRAGVVGAVGVAAAAGPRETHREEGHRGEAPDRIALTPEEAVGRAGTVTPAHVAYAHDLLAALPAVVTAAAEEPYGARALAYALLISRDEAVRAAQIARLAQFADPGVLKTFNDILPMVSTLEQSAYLPLVDLSLPALRTLSDAQYQRFRENLHQLVEADRRVSPFELALLSVLQRHLDRHFAGAASVTTARRTLGRTADECGVLLSALARLDRGDADAAAAFDAGVARLGIANAPSLRPAGGTDLAAVRTALNTLAALAPWRKRGVIAACTATVAQDGRMTVAEGEILRAVSDALEVPMPPFIPGGRADAGAAKAGPWS